MSADLVAALAALALLASPAAADSYFIYDDYGGSWADAEKTIANADDDRLCWAASASNILWYTGWGHVDGMSDADAMFAYFQTHWSDDLGSPYYAWDWWFDGENDRQGEAIWAQEDVDGGGGFFPTLTASDYIRFEGNDSDTMSSLDSWLHDGYGSTLSIDGNMAHSITVWGYEYDATGYLGVYVTDSDDNMSPPQPDKLQYYDVTLNGGKWWLSGGYYGDGNDNFINEVVSLQIMPDIPAIPEPASLILFGFGLGLVGLVRARRRTR